MPTSTCVSAHFVCSSEDFNGVLSLSEREDARMVWIGDGMSLERMWINKAARWVYETPAGTLYGAGVDFRTITVWDNTPLRQPGAPRIDCTVACSESQLPTTSPTVA